MSHRLVTNRYIVMSPSQDGWLASHQIPTAYLCTLCVTCPTSCQEVSWATSGDETTSRWESVTYIQLTDELCARRQERRKKTRSAQIAKADFLFYPSLQKRPPTNKKKKLSKLPGEDKWRRQRQLLSTPRNFFFFKDVENKSKNKFVGKEKSRAREEWSINNTTKKGRRLESKKKKFLY